MDQNIFLFFGDDSFSRMQKIKLWKQKFCEKHGGDMNLTELKEKSIAPNDVRQAVQAVPFLAEKRLTIVYDYLTNAPAEEQKNVITLLDEIPDFSVLVFSEQGTPDGRLSLYKKLKKIAVITEFPTLQGAALIRFIEAKAREIGAAEITKTAASKLAAIVGGDLWRMEQELSKLISYAGKNPITEKEIDILVDTTLTSSIFKLTDAIAARNARASLKELKTLTESGEELHYLFHMIIRQFRLIIQMKDFTEQQKLPESTIIGKVKQHPFVVKNAIRQSRNFAVEHLKKIYGALLQIDIGLKTGKIKTATGDDRELLLAIDRFVLETCK